MQARRRSPSRAHIASGLNPQRSGKPRLQLLNCFRDTVVIPGTVEDPQIPIEDFWSYEALAKKMNLDAKEA
jgi:hypothetical protein